LRRAFPLALIIAVRISVRAATLLLVALSLVPPAASQTIILRPAGGGRTQALPGTKLTVPLVIDMTGANGLDMAALSADIAFGSPQLTLDSIRTGGFGTLSQTIGANGTATASVNGPATFSTVTMANAFFTVSGTTGSSTTLKLTPTSAFDSQDNIITGFIKVLDLDVCIAPPTKWGDTDGNNSVDIIDAQQIARFAVGLSVVNSPVLAAQADVNADNSVNIIDAQQIARFSVGLSASARVNAASFTPPAAAAVDVSVVRNAVGGAMVPGSSASLSSLAVGDQAQIRPSITNASNADISACAVVSYSSSSPSVAAVSTSGLITALGAGTSTITVTSGSKVATLNVVVQTFGLIALKTGTGGSIDSVGTLQSSNPPVFVARNGAGTPTANVSIDLVASGGCLLSFSGSTPASSLTLISDVNGEVKPAVSLPTGIDGAGCVVSASTSNTQFPIPGHSVASVYPAGTTHVWTGATDANWTTATNWVRPSAAPAAPSATTDQVFIPTISGISNLPHLSSSITLQRLALGTGGVVFMNGNTVNIGTGGVTGYGYAVGGTVHAATTANFGGYFDTLQVGQPGSCGAAAPMTAHLGNVNANTIHIYCRTSVDTIASASVLTIAQNGGEGRLSLANNSALSIVSDVVFAGDQLNVGGSIYVGGNAAFSSTSITGGSTTSPSVYVQGTATFNAPAATYNNVFFNVTGDVIVGGGAAGSQQFINGQLNVNGNFTQLGGSVANTFATSVNHQTTFQGSGVPQSITLANAASNPFTILRVLNPGGVTTFNSSVSVLQTSGSTASSVGLDLSAGTLVIPASTALNVSGFIALSTGTTFTVNGAVTVTNGTCHKSGTTTGTVVNGSGTVNGQSPAIGCP
jgi:hypothetical protein